MNQRTVYVVEDDAGVRRLLERTFELAGYHCAGYDSAEAFLREHVSGRPGCLVLDAGLPGMSGLDLQRDLQDRGDHLPIVFLTGRADVPMVRAAMKNGCMEFLEKPYRDEELLDAVRRAMQLDSRLRRQQKEVAAIQTRLASLTPRERQVLEMVVAGNTNKQISAACGVSARTVEIHRSNVMKKMGAESLAQLVQLCIRAQQAAG